MNIQSKLGIASLLATLLLPAAAMPQAGNQRLTTYLQSLPLQTVDASERLLLEHMREEEKLARDVYRVLHQQWNLPVFDNIADAEQSHMDLVLWALQRYQIADPVPSNQPGVYANPAFTALFQFATSIAQTSPVHAMMVGAVIEDLDITDLEYAIARTDNRDIDTVWQNLLRGSRNHLRAFYQQLHSVGITYTGLFLSTQEVLAIVTAPQETRPVDENGVPLP